MDASIWAAAGRFFPPNQSPLVFPTSLEAGPEKEKTPTTTTAAVPS